MREKLLRPAWVEIDLDALTYNAKNILDIAGDCECIAVLKSDGYGMGGVRVAKLLKDIGYNYFAVATLEEAIALRKSGIEDMVLVLGLIPNENVDEVVKNDITVMVTAYDGAKALNDEAAKQGKKADCFVAVDTGMHRIGYIATDIENLVSEVKKLTELKNLNLIGMHSHFAVADEEDKTFSYLQLDRFNKAYDALVAAGIKLPKRMIANSAAFIDMPETLEFEMCRPGFIIYGIYPSEAMRSGRLKIKSIITVKAKIAHVKTIQKGDTVGYGRAFTANGPTRIATLPIGFADGLPRAYSEKGRAIVGGKIVPLAGNICMDQMMIDVTTVPDAKVGDEVILMGSDGKNEITPEELADSVPNTVVDEIMGGLNQRLPKLYVKSSDPEYCEVAYRKY